MPCPERGKRHGIRMALSFLLSPCILPSTQKIRPYAFSIQTAGAAQKQEQWEEGLAKTSSHTQALLMQLRYLAGLRLGQQGYCRGPTLKRIIVPVSSQAIIHGRLGSQKC